MRWDDLFDDLEGQAEHARRQDLAAEVADRTRREQATVRLGDRVRAATDPLTWTLRDGSRLPARVTDAGPGWFLLADAAGRQVLLAAHAVVAVEGVPAWSAPPAGPVAARRTLLMAVRALGEAGERVRVQTATATWAGRIVRVGADHLDLEPVDGLGEDSVLTLLFEELLAVHEAP